MEAYFKKLVAQMLDNYATVIILLVLVATGSYFVMMEGLQEQEGDSTMVRMSSEQGQYIQDINVLLTKLIYLTDKQKRTDVRGEINNKIQVLTETHDYLRTGTRYIRVNTRLTLQSGVLSPKMRALFFDGGKSSVDSLMGQFVIQARKLSKTEPGVLALQTATLQELYFKITPTLIEGMAKINAFTQQESEKKLAGITNIQNITFALTLASLLLVGVLLLKPLVEHLQESMSKVKEEKNFADNVINTAQAIIIGLDQSGRLVLFNHNAEENTGWVEAEVVGNEFMSQFIPEDNRDKFQKLFTGMMAGEIEYADELETPMIISSGELIDVVWHTTTILNTKTQKPAMFLATGLNITERKVAEAKLQHAHAEMAKISERLQDEVNLAATLQQSILPEPKIELPGLVGEASLLTSTEVGGDYYDYYKVDGYTSVLLVGDVSGHGVAAGTMVSAAKAGIYPLINEGISSPSEILNSLNKTMLATAQRELLMTMACVSLDGRTGKAVFANAGHVLPYIWRTSEEKWEMLEAGGLPLGQSKEFDYKSAIVELQMEVGDRLFLYTDGIVEEESPSGEAFGYERLEQILEECGDADEEFIREALMTSLEFHCQGSDYEDDVTIVLVTHTDRVMEASSSTMEVSDIIRIADDYYREDNHPIPRISKEYVVFMADNDFSDLLTRFSHDGICRVLPRKNQFCKEIGMDLLLSQHHESPDDDIFFLMPEQPTHRQFQLTHTEDKMFIMEEIHSWLSEQDNLPGDQVDALSVLLDEVIENSLYAAPRDGKGVPYYEKGVSRELSSPEEVRIDIAFTDKQLGLMITDNWGTLTPGVFLKNLARAMEEGVEAGVGGAGLYMMWRLSDYLQVRVHPQQRTQVTLLWDLNGTVDMDVESGFQFINHSEYEAILQTKAA